MFIIRNSEIHRPLDRAIHPATYLLRKLKWGSSAHFDKYNCSGESTYVISAGAAGEIGYCKEPFWAADDCLICSTSDKVLNKYIYYYLLTEQDYIRRKVRTASIPRLSRDVIEKMQIPLPPLEEQTRIVAILDRFDTLCNDISVGLPAEIEARRKQYEYYSNKLLSFTRLPERQVK